MSILDLRKELEKGKSGKDVFDDAALKAINFQREYNPFVTIIDNYEHEESESILNNIPYALKDNFSTKGVLTTGSSNILKDYVPVFDSTVYKKLKESGAVLVGKTVLDELAMGGSGLTGHTGIVRNPFDKTRIAGGSSAGSAAAVALNIVPFAIGSDTGDSVRKPAAYCGVVGFKPTYGRISRFGLFPFASSLDHVGIFSRCVKDAAIVTDVLKGQDDKDMTTLPDDNVKYGDNLNGNLKGKKLFYIKEVVESASSDIFNNFNNVLEKLRNEGVQIEKVSFDKNLLEVLYITYFIISCAEATSNNSNLTGFIFGPRGKGNTPEEVMINTRSEGFGEMIKRRFVIGSYILEKENQEKLFKNAGRVRNMIVTKMNLLFKEYDGLILPAASSIAPKINPEEEVDKLGDEYLILDNHLVIGNFGGYPSITLPSGFIDDMPIAINLTCAQKEDFTCLNIAYGIEKALGGEKNV